MEALKNAMNDKMKLRIRMKPQRRNKDHDKKIMESARSRRRKNEQQRKEDEIVNDMNNTKLT